MAVCIECANKNTGELFCGKCGKRADKYREVNRAYRIIDLILLKEGVFRHYLLNGRPGMLEFTVLFGVHCVTFCTVGAVLPRIGTVVLQGNGELDLQYNNTCLQIVAFVLYVIGHVYLSGHMDGLLVAYSVLFSSFFNFLKIICALWGCTHPQYFVIADVLSSCGNIVALNSIYRDFVKAFSSVFLLKIIQTAVVVIF